MNRHSLARLPDAGFVASSPRRIDSRVYLLRMEAFRTKIKFERRTPLAECAIVQVAREALGPAGDDRADQKTYSRPNQPRGRTTYSSEPIPRGTPFTDAPRTVNSLKRK